MRRLTLLLIALLAAGCASRPAAAPAAPGAAPGAQAAGAPSGAALTGAPRKLSVTEPTHGAGYLPLYVAQRRGYFAEEGLEVESITMTGGPDVNAVLSGQAWGHIGAPERVANALLKGGDIRVVGTIANRGLTYLVARPGVEDTDMTEKLRGKRIATGTFGGTPNAVTRYVLRQAGLDPQRDVTLLELESSAIPASVDRGQADIAAVNEPMIRQGIAKGMWGEPFYGAPQGIGPYLYTSLSVSGQALRAEPDVAVAMLRGLIRGFRALNDGGVEGTLPIAQAEFPTMDAEDLRATLVRSFNDQLWQFDGPLATPSDPSFEAMVDVGLLSGTFKDRIAFRDVVDTTFVERAHATLAAR
jgi:NitT/TauT family transport system substrate-binding protein